MTDLIPLMSSAKDDWETPPAFFDLVNAEFRFALDVCATAKNTKCPRFFSPEEDGLSRDWWGPAWMNPPYGSAVVPWLHKAAAESLKQRILVACLVPARTDTKWWWSTALRAREIRFLKGRIKFIGGPSGAPFPSALVIFDGSTAPEPGRPGPEVVWWDWKAQLRECSQGGE